MPAHITSELAGSLKSTWTLPILYGESVGHACIAVEGPMQRELTIETGLDDRERNRWRFAKKALQRLEVSIRAVD